MLGTRSRAKAVSLLLALKAQQVFFLHFISLGHFFLAVDQAAVVRLLATIALVEGACVHGKLQWLVVIVVAFSHDSSFLINAFSFGLFQSADLYKLPQFAEYIQLFLDLWAVISLDLLLATRAVHKRESYPH